MPSKYSDLAFQGERVAMTWFDEQDGNQEVYLLVAPDDRIGTAVERTGVRVTDTAGESMAGLAGWAGERVGLAWCDNTSGQHEIYFELFDAAGRPVHAATRVTTTPAESLIPAIRGVGDGFALVWNEFRPGAGGAHGHDGRSEVWTPGRRRLSATARRLARTRRARPVPRDRTAAAGRTSGAGRR